MKFTKCFRDEVSEVVIKNVRQLHKQTEQKWHFRNDINRKNVNEYCV